MTNLFWNTLKIFVFLIITSFPQAHAEVASSCLNELTRSLESAEQNKPLKDQLLMSVPVQCQYYVLNDLTEGMKMRILLELKRRGKTAPNDTKLTEIFALLRYKAHAKVESSWLKKFEQEKCEDYTGSPLSECESGNIDHFTGSSCDIIFEFAKKCKELHLCNSHVKATKMCRAASDFDSGKLPTEK